jgi:two-component system, sensor histidine kinase and response regulator
VDPRGQLAALFVADADTRLVGLREALAGNDFGAIALSAHTLNGASACLGATELASLCAALERSCAANGLQGVGVALDEIEAELGRVRAALGDSPPR